MHNLKQWRPLQDGSFQRNNNLTIIPLPNNKWSVSHPGSIEDTNPVFSNPIDAMCAAEDGGPEIPSIQPGDQWVN